MNLPTLRRRKSEGMSPRPTDWLERPWSTAREMLQRPLDMLARPLQEWFEPAFPRVNVSETDTDVRVEADVPGMRDKDITVSYHEGVLTIAGEKKEERTQERAGKRYSESRYGTFSREIPLGANLAWENSKASCNNGVLTVTIPKKEGARGRGKRIEIQ